jgi:hypothetical protein
MALAGPISQIIPDLCTQRSRQINIRVRIKIFHPSVLFLSDFTHTPGHAKRLRKLTLAGAAKGHMKTHIAPLSLRQQIIFASVQLRKTLFTERALADLHIARRAHLTPLIKGLTAV